MTLLSKFKKTPPSAPAVPPNRAHPLEAIPLRSENVQQRKSSQGELHLRGNFPRTGWWGRLMPKSKRTVQIALDEKGALFWSLINGQRNLFAISSQLQARFDLGEAESREATILFVKMLMRRGFLQLKFHPVRGGTPTAKKGKADS
jgi:hypothetical protein